MGGGRLAAERVEVLARFGELSRGLVERRLCLVGVALCVKQKAVGLGRRAPRGSVLLLEAGDPFAGVRDMSLPLPSRALRLALARFF